MIEAAIRVLIRQELQTERERIVQAIRRVERGTKSHPVALALHLLANEIESGPRRECRPAKEDAGE